MGETTAIAWCDHSFNPWWGCTKIAAPAGERSACDFCYADAFAHRLGMDLWGKDADRRFFGDKHWAEPRKWDRQAEADGRQHRVFCASMADVFENRRDLDAPRARLFALIEETPHLDWQLLTKRPECVMSLLPSHWINGRGIPTNVWMGTTVENQRTADLRIPRLLNIPAAVRFLSCEPLLGRINLRRWLPYPIIVAGDVGRKISWVICGGESGAGHFPLDPAWAGDLRDQCAEAGVPFFFKQVGGRTPTAGGDELDGRRHKEFPTTARSA